MEYLRLRLLSHTVTGLATLVAVSLLAVPLLPALLAVITTLSTAIYNMQLVSTPT
jgi:hypothetical protein